MLTPYRALADGIVQFTVIAPLPGDLVGVRQWLESLCLQEHRQLTEVFLLPPPLGEGEHFPQKLQLLFLEYRARLLQCPYIFHWFQDFHHGDADGLNLVLNRAAQRANGQWIYLLPGDRRLLRSSFLEFAAVIHEFPETEVISGRFLGFNPGGDVVEKSPELATEGFSLEKFQHHLLTNNPLQMGCTLYRRDIWARFGGFPKHHQRVAEWAFLRRLSYHHLHWYYIPRPVCAYPIATHHGQLIDTQGRVIPEYLRFIFQEDSEDIFSPQEQAKYRVCQQFLRYVSLCFQDRQFVQGYRAIFDFLAYLPPGDRQWDFCLQRLPGSTIPHRQEIFQLIQQIKREFFARPQNPTPPKKTSGGTGKASSLPTLTAHQLLTQQLQLSQRTTQTKTLCQFPPH